MVIKSFGMINSSGSGILSFFKWLVFNNSSGSFAHFAFFGLGGPEGWTDWRLAHPAVRLPASRSRRAPNLAGRRPRRFDLHFGISLATECRLSYPGPFVKRKMRAVPRLAVAPPSSRQLLWGELPADGGGQFPIKRHHTQSDRDLPGNQTMMGGAYIAVYVCVTFPRCLCRIHTRATPRVRHLSRVGPIT